MLGDYINLITIKWRLFIDHWYVWVVVLAIATAVKIACRGRAQ